MNGTKQPIDREGLKDTDNLRGRKRCYNRRCRAKLFADYVTMRTPKNARVRLCFQCFDMPLRDIPEVQRAAAEADRLFSTYGAV